MAQTYTDADIAAVYKHLYPRGIEEMILEHDPFIGMVQKSTDFSGDGKYLNWKVGHGGGDAVTLANAIATTSAQQHKRPFITRSREYAVKQLDHESLEASEKSEGAMVSLLKDASESAIELLKLAASVSIWGNGGGARGRLSSTTTVNTADVTLEDPVEAVNFWVGQRIQASATDGNSGAVKAAGTGYVTLAGVNRITGVLTASLHWDDAITNPVAASDYLFRYGDFGAVVKGVFAWCPTSDPTSGESFFTLDRSSYPEQMAGSRYSPSGGSYDECCQDILARHYQVGGEHDTLFLNPIDWGELAKEIGTKDRTTRNAIGSNGKEIATIGYKGIQVMGPNGAVTVLPARRLKRRAYLGTNMKSWEIWSLNEPWRLLGRGAGEGGFLRQVSADASELRWGGYYQLVNHRPIDSICGSLPST